jgi:hypothetical protein
MQARKNKFRPRRKNEAPLPRWIYPSEERLQAQHRFQIQTVNIKTCGRTGGQTLSSGKLVVVRRSGPLLPRNKQVWTATYIY